MNKGEPLTLAHASKIWWERVYNWLVFPLAQIDVDTCDEQLLALLAYQRDIDRFPGESLTLFRLRVKYAFVNAQDAGSNAGFARIFERLEIGQIQQLERQLWLDWDVVLLRINDEQLSRDNALMMRLVRQYGRTTRRYFFDVLNQQSLSIRAGRFDLDAGYHNALFVPTFEIVRFHVNDWMSSSFQPVTSFAGATYMIEAQGAVGEITWTATGPASVTPMGGMECQVIITGPGDITITGNDTRDRTVTHAITPSLWFLQDGTKQKIVDAEKWANSLWGRTAQISELTYGTYESGMYTRRGVMGSLWSEWGDMAVYGWPGAPEPGVTWADWWITLSPAQVANYIYMPILAGTHNRAQDYSSNGTVTTVLLGNTNSFRCCAVWDSTASLAIKGYYINGWYYADFKPKTSFAGAKYKIYLVGHGGKPITWQVTGPATVTADGEVTITGPGSVSITGKNYRGETITHAIEPTLYFIPSKEQILQADMPVFAAANNGRMPTQGEMSSRPYSTTDPILHRKIGSLWSEWGNLGAYGWLQWRGTPGREEEHYATTTPGSVADTHLFIRIQSGVPTDIGTTNTNKFAVAAVIDLPVVRGK